MRKHLRYLSIFSVILILSALLLPAISATRKNIVQPNIEGKAPGRARTGTGGFLLASLMMADDGFTDLGVTKFAASDQVVAGANLSYTIEVRNGGPEPAIDATLTDDLPPGMTFVSLTSPAAWTCSQPAVGDGGTVSCVNSSLAADSVDSFTLVVKVPTNAEPGAFFNNTAVVSTSTPDSNDENNSYPAGTMVSSNAVDVGVKKTASADMVVPGADLTYTIEVSKGGPNPAQDVTWSDTLPGDMTFVSMTTTASDWNCTTPAVGAGGTVTCSKTTITASSSSDTFTLVGHVPAGTSPGATYLNTAKVTTTTPDYNSENDSSTTETTVAAADLSVTKVDTSDPVTVGNNLTYTITVDNAGPSPAIPVVLSDTLPAGTTFVSLSTPGNWACTTPAQGTGGSITCSSDVVPRGSQAFSLVVKVSPSLSGGTVLSNTATVASSTPDSNPGNESATATTTVLSPSNISATKSVAGQFAPGNTVAYSVVLGNTGPGTQGDNPGNEFTDVLPSSLTLVSATSSGGNVAANTVTNTVTWNGILGVGSTVTINIQATIKSGTAGTTISNQGQISYDADGNGTNEASAVTDDPGVAGSNNPTSFAVQNAPTISALSLTRTAGSAASNSTIANVSDAEDAKNSLSVKVNNGPSATMNGVTVSNIGVNAAGLVTADVSAPCGATSATFTLKVTDSDGLSSTAALAVTVNSNSVPALTYAASQTVAFGGSLNVNPATGPSDNGSVSSIVVQSQGTYTGTISVNSSTGAVSISNAAPAGTHTITIRATDNCGVTTDASFNLTVGAQPTLSINSTSVTEGNTGTTAAVFTVTLSPASAQAVKVDYATANSTALSDSDYQATAGTLTFNPGETTRTITVQVNGDGADEADETFLVNLTNPQSAALAAAQGTGTILNDDGASIQLSSESYDAAEDESHATITVTRTGDLSRAAAVDYKTSDLAGLNNCNVKTGDASARCDYTAVGGTLAFLAGESSKSFTVPLINDTYLEGPETLTITLSNAAGATLGAPAAATLRITDDDSTTGAANPIDGREFLVRQLYLDTLNREPEPSGLAAWLNRLNTCPQGDTSCDEIEVASAFFRSPEFFDRSYFIYKTYEVALGRQPQYDEYQRDVRRVTGFLSAQELELRKQEFISEFITRQEFRDKYDSIHDAIGYVSTLSQTAGVKPSSENQLANDLGTGVETRADVLRAYVDSPEVSQRFFNKAFVVVGYFAFLRRNPDINYLRWIDTLNTTGDYREMIRGFLMSAEYRSRFGQTN